MKQRSTMTSDTARHPFSLVEIMLALGVVAIGVISIMGLFPIGLNAARDTATETYAANAAEELLNYFKNYTAYTPQNQQQANDRWDECFGTSGAFKLIASKNESTQDTTEDKTPATPPQNDDFQNPITPKDLKDCKKLDPDFSDTIYYKGADFSDTFLLLSQRGTPTGDNKPQMTDVDFSAVATLSYTKDEQNLLYTLYAEIAWPANRPASARTRKTYALTLLNPYNDDYIRLLQRPTDKKGGTP